MNLKIIPIESVQVEKQRIKSLNETLNNMQYGINKTKQGIEGFKKQINLYNEALVHDNNIFTSEQMKLIQAENGLKSTYERAKNDELNQINNTKKIIKHINNENDQIEKQLTNLE